MFRVSTTERSISRAMRTQVLTSARQDSSIIFECNHPRGWFASYEPDRRPPQTCGDIQTLRAGRKAYAAKKTRHLQCHPEPGAKPTEHYPPPDPTHQNALMVFMLHKRPNITAPMLVIGTISSNVSVAYISKASTSASASRKSGGDSE